MPNDSIESLFEDAVNASENPNEGKDAAKFITAAPKPKIDENELRLQQQREEEIRLMKQKEEMERQEAIKRAEEKRKAEAEAKNAEEKAKREAQERLERQRQEQIEKDRKHQAELLRKQQEAEQIKLKEQQEKEQREQALKEQEEKRLQEENKRVEQEQQLERQRQLEEEQRKARLKGNPFAVENVSLVLTVSDSYRGYDLSSQEAVKSFFNEEDESTIISAVLNETNEIRAALHSLILAQQAEQVDRAFLLVSLDVNLLTNMGKIMSTYTGADLPISALPGNRIEYCRALEKAISSMSTDQQSNLEAIQRLLAIPTK